MFGLHLGKYVYPFGAGINEFTMIYKGLCKLGYNSGIRFSRNHGFDWFYKG